MKVFSSIFTLFILCKVISFIETHIGARKLIAMKQKKINNIQNDSQMKWNETKWNEMYPDLI